MVKIAGPKPRHQSMLSRRSERPAQDECLAVEDLEREHNEVQNDNNDIDFTISILILAVIIKMIIQFN